MTLKQTNPPVLKLSGVTKRIGKKTIVDGLSFEVRGGEIVGLLGPNGAGKTTAMRMMTGLIRMSEGDVTVAGSSIRDRFKEAIAQVGGIIENPEFYPYMSGFDNLKQAARMTDSVTDQRIAEVIGLLGLEEAQGKKVKTYSLGMRQRLGIAQALLDRPKLLILDEPNNGLDPAGIREMRDYLKQIAHSEGIAILVSSHLLSEIEQMCSRVVVIQNGRLVTERKLGGREAGAADLPELRIRVDKPEEARRAIEALERVKLERVSEAESEVTCLAADADMAALIDALRLAGVTVYRIAETRKSLEDEFLQWTGGNQIA
ncbi:ATP-binding cassette domain-containing protein [Saccharibacillus sp. CPCC 101409]|uniref:ABC transporter ATP-binding protein n=1 Tax=Saccharibacillus sp. CPCC 101409 TaxID=3058041 RepID=UPI00267309F2|nr:ATP-binding cassette domain-containing protein [Saccharibacillus sp. CPCC 101409]MDO3408876.1 ATP-binding cassette domain-containing protein [Saccharibacillus sp. CPCC 101409]